jgi:NAD+ kinase
MSERRILVVSHTARDEAIEATVNVVAKLRAEGVVAVMHASDRVEFAPHLSLDQTVELGSEVDIADLEVALVLGGDGTILRAAELLRGSACPILGVNLGHVGFLAEAESHDLKFTLDRVLAGRYQVEERMTIDVTASMAGETIAETWAVNEASVEKLGRMLEVALGVDRRPLTSFGCDGVVLSTPTGSTAYSFSAGGPVVWPGVQALLAVPLAAHALFNRPIVVGPNSVLTVEILPQSGGRGVLWCDGRRRTELPVGAVIEVRASKLPLRLARIDEGVFTDRLVNKFHLPVSGWRGDRSRSQ